MPSPTAATSPGKPAAKRKSLEVMAVRVRLSLMFENHLRKVADCMSSFIFIVVYKILNE
jgi:hypothetical protein